jgi:hypothetical protein
MYGSMRRAVSQRLDRLAEESVLRDLQAQVIPELAGRPGQASVKGLEQDRDPELAVPAGQVLVVLHRGQLPAELDFLVGP